MVRIDNINFNLEFSSLNILGTACCMGSFHQMPAKKRASSSPQWTVPKTLRDTRSPWS